MVSNSRFEENEPFGLFLSDSSRNRFMNLSVDFSSWAIWMQISTGGSSEENIFDNLLIRNNIVDANLFAGWKPQFVFSYCCGRFSAGYKIR